MSPDHRNEDRRLRVAAIGECMIELARSESGELQQGFAGDTANTAAYLARLLGSDDCSVSYVTAVGDDPFSSAMLDGWRAEGIETGLVRRIDGRLPGVYWIKTRPDGERSFYYWRGESAARLLMTDDYGLTLREALAGHDLVFASGITLGILSSRHREELQALLEALHRSGTRVTFDGNFRKALWTDPAEALAGYEALLGATSIALFSVEDAERLWAGADAETLCRRIADLGAEEVVLRRGTEPCLVLSAGAIAEVAPPTLAAAVDTTAAGDAFDAAYIAARLRGTEPAAAALAGHRLAARVVARPGALIPREETPVLAQILD